MSAWQWYWSEDPDIEYCRLGEATREATIAAARAECDGRPFTIVEAQKGTPGPPSGEDVVTLWSEQHEDSWSEDGFEGLMGSTADIEAAEGELTALIAGWFERHAALIPESWLFTDTRNQERIDAPEPADDEARIATLVEESGLPEHVVRQAAAQAQGAPEASS